MELLPLLLSGIVVGVIGVVFGGSMFISIPLFQSLFPNMIYGQIIGNIKIGGIFRGLASSYKTWGQIQVKDAVEIIIPFVISSIIATASIAKLDQDYLIFGVITAIILSELGPKISHLINKRRRLLFSIILGLYNGLIGAGMGILLVALLRTIFPKKDQIIFVKIQARFIELIGSTTVVLGHIYYGNINFPIWIVWSIGMLLGGIIGGNILKKTVKLSAKVQHAYLICVYIIALLPFAKNLI